MNPITITEWPDASRECIRIIAEHNTPGDTAAFGLESADPRVQAENNLNVTAEECFEAVKIVNEEAGWRPGEDAEAAPTHGEGAANRLPKLLPGINLLHGLKAEREETYEHNREFLQRVYDEELMLRRINIRQVMAFDGTDMSETGAEIAHDHKELFKSYKKEIRQQIDQPMLERVTPQGTVLPDVHLEYHQDGRTFGRQLGTYPLLVGIPGEHPLETTIDAVVVDHGYRSVTAVPYPLDINSATMNELEALPEIGRQRAGDIIVDRPYETAAEAGDQIDLTKYVTANPSQQAD